MLGEQAPQLALADTQALSQPRDAALVQGTGFDQAQGPGNGIGVTRVRHPAPGSRVRCRFRPAAQTRPQACLLGGGGRREKQGIFRFGRRCRADRTTIDAGGSDTDEKASVEALVATGQGPVAHIMIEVHAAMIIPIALTH
ncbi:hypothetical protein D3C80_577850 [compost metagenome]